MRFKTNLKEKYTMLKAGVIITLSVNNLIINFWWET